MFILFLCGGSLKFSDPPQFALLHRSYWHEALGQKVIYKVSLLDSQKHTDKSGRPCSEFRTWFQSENSWTMYYGVQFFTRFREVHSKLWRVILNYPSYTPHPTLIYTSFNLWSHRTWNFQICISSTFEFLAWFLYFAGVTGSTNLTSPSPT